MTEIDLSSLGVFDEGILGSAGVEIADVPDNPFGIDRKQWYPIQVVGYKEPKVTANGDKVGMSLIFKAVDPAPENLVKMESLGFGNWYQLPTPERLQKEFGMPWDKESPDAKKVNFFWLNFYKALGFPADQMKRIRPQDLVGMQCLSRISVFQDDQGFWKFNFPSFAQIPENGKIEGLGDIGVSSSGNAGLSPDELLQREINGG